MSYTRQKSLIKIGGWKNVVFNYIILIPQIVNCTNCVTLRKYIIFSLHVQFLIEFNIDIYYLCKYANLKMTFLSIFKSLIKVKMFVLYHKKLLIV